MGSWNPLSEIKILGRIPYVLKCARKTENHGFLPFFPPFFILLGTIFYFIRNHKCIIFLCVNFTEAYFALSYLWKHPHPSPKTVSWIPLSKKCPTDGFSSLCVCACASVLAYLHTRGTPPGLVHLHNKNHLSSSASLPHFGRDCSCQGTRFDTQSEWMACLVLKVTNSAFLLFSIHSVLHKPPNPGEAQNLCHGSSVVSMPPEEDIDDALNNVMMVSHVSAQWRAQFMPFLKTPPKTPSILITSTMESDLATLNGWMMLTNLPVALQYEGSLHWKTCSQLSEWGLDFSLMCLCSLALRSA